MTPVPETRPSLLLRLRDARDQQAWSLFLELSLPVILRLIQRRGLQEADALEVTQEVLLAVAGAIERWEADPARGAFRSWVNTIARNLVVNFLIRQSRHPRGSSVNQWLLERPASGGEMSALVDVETKRQAFWKTAEDDVSVVDAARELKLPVGSVYVARSRVMKRLREKVEEVRE